MKLQIFHLGLYSVAFVLVSIKENINRNSCQDDIQFLLATIQKRVLEEIDENIPGELSPRNFKKNEHSFYYCSYSIQPFLSVKFIVNFQEYILDLYFFFRCWPLNTLQLGLSLFFLLSLSSLEHLPSSVCIVMVKFHKLGSLWRTETYILQVPGVKRFKFFASFGDLAWFYSTSKMVPQILHPVERSNCSSEGRKIEENVFMNGSILTTSALPIGPYTQCCCLHGYILAHHVWGLYSDHGLFPCAACRTPVTIHPLMLCSYLPCRCNHS